MLSMRDMTYTIGIKIRLYPSDSKKDIIAYNDGAARFIYNRLVARHKELFSLRQVKVYVKPVAERIAYLESLGQKSSDFKANYSFLEDKRIDAQTIANAIKNYRTAWRNFATVPGTSIPTFHYSVKSNRESGEGRPDIALVERKFMGRVVILEVKVAKRFSEMKKKCEEALKQIEEEKYALPFEEDGYQEILNYGVCFYKKGCIILQSHS